tara:strand:- start:182 stop:469 length:288 start_codon:yes stop_codon:yes gene_type:complete
MSKTDIYNDILIKALISIHEQHCEWSGQDPTDHEVYYDESAPEINKLFEEHYNYIGPCIICGEIVELEDGGVVIDDEHKYCACCEDEHTAIIILE